MSIDLPHQIHGLADSEQPVGLLGLDAHGRTEFFNRIRAARNMAEKFQLDRAKQGAGFLE